MNFIDFSELDLNGSTEYLFNRVSGIEVKLTQEIANKANRIATIRKENHKNHNKSDFNDNADLIGLYGECIFGKYYNLPVDWSIKLRDDFDFQINNTFIDVKTSEYSPNLAVKSLRLHENYIYVFCACRLKFNDGKIIGWLRGFNIKNFGTEVTDVKEAYWKVPYTLLNEITTLDCLMV